MGNIPRLFFGTAWKNPFDVMQAVRAGFRGIAIAGDPKHFYEVGAALGALQARGVRRESLYIQVQVMIDDVDEPSYADSLDWEEMTRRFQMEEKRKATDMGPSMSERVDASLKNSLKRLELEYIDCLVMPFVESQEEMLEAWHAMEDAVRAGLVRHLGVANVLTLAHLRKLVKNAAV